MSNHLRVMLVLLSAAVLALLLVVAIGAANRDGVVTFTGVPGPAKVTYNKNVGYQSTFANQSPSGVFTHTTFIMEAPVASGVAATFVKASCGTQLTTVNAAGRTQYSCDFGTLRPADPAILVTIVWTAPDLSIVNPACASTPCSLVAGDDSLARMYWVVKERVNDQPDFNDSFNAPAPVSTILLAKPDPVEAGGFQISGLADPSTCSTTTTPSLETNRSLTETNKLSTRLCLPVFSPGLALGVATKIDERNADTATDGSGVITQVSDVCVADLGQTCPATAPFNFGTSKLISVFEVPDSAILSKAKITKWFHRPGGGLLDAPGAILPPCSTAGAGDCADITYNAKTKIWTIVAKTETNGRFGGGG